MVDYLVLSDTWQYGWVLVLRDTWLYGWVLVLSDTWLYGWVLSFERYMAVWISTFFCAINGCLVEYLVLSDTSLYGWVLSFERYMAVWMSTQFQDVARHQCVICFRIFIGTYCLYHKRSEVTSQKNGLLGIYCVILHSCRKYFVTYVQLLLYRMFCMYCYEQKY